VKSRSPRKRQVEITPPAPPEDASVEPADAAVAGSPFPIVGVGASAGGLAVFTQMLGALPADTGMAFVLVQHLSPAHVSSLSEILSRTTALPVIQVQDEPRVKPDHVYVIPPDRNMIISKGLLKLLPRETAPNQHRPIDFFFRSLAEEQGHRAIGVILSGSATDGTLGLMEIKAEGGITFAQDDTAEYGSMPRSAIASGCVDFVLSPQEIAAEIGRIARHPHVAPAPARRKKAAEAEPDLQKILGILHKGTGVDFSLYKASTISRRISRRMVLHKVEELQDYARILQNDSGEVEALYQDVLINVTSFFRDPETFEAIRTRILPKLFKDRLRKDPLRVWVLGCSTGEEAYSLAITFAEMAEARGLQAPVQIFASDLNETGIEKARAGVYSKSIAADVPPERLRRYFVEVEGGYRINKSIREMCVFARHDVLSDPPFSRMDLISCRNLLIYLQPALQQKVLPLLHFALKPNGFLVLGSSETVRSYRDLFDVEDARNKLFTRKPGLRRVVAGHAAGRFREQGEVGSGPGRRQQAVGPESSVEISREADRVLLTRYVPPGVLVGENLEILQFYGETGPYLTPAPGKASLSLFKMLREGLLVRLQAAINRVRKEKAPVRQEGVWGQSESGAREVDLEVVPVRGGGFLILFEEPAHSPSLPLPRGKNGRGKAPKTAAEDAAGEESAERQNVRLTQELAATREYLQSMVEQQEAANEELQAANEEVQSANEELQSINEELETSQEEIQSSNEELITLNDELQSRNQELNLLNSDLINLLSSVDLAVLMLGKDLRIRRFTHVAEKTFHLSPTDVGRSITEIKLNLDVPDLERLLLEVIDTVSARELEVQDRLGAWYSLRIRPYKTLENQIDGVIVVLIDVDTLKKLQEALHLRIHDLNAADRSKNEFLALLAHELRNPLAPLRNAVELLDAPGVDGTAIEQARNIMGRQVQNMTRMIEDLLDVARITQGKIQLRRQRVVLATLLTEAMEMVRPHAETRGQELSLSLPPEPVEVDADPVRLEQVFGNILNNAAKFTQIGGHIRVTAELAGSGKRRREDPPAEIVVRMRDDGVGMDPETLARVFDLFMQADRTLDRSRGGLGIGLTLVRRLVELHGGTVEAHSAGVGQGSEFVVRLPVLPPLAAEPEQRGGRGEEPAAAEVSSPDSPAPRRILVVDDNVDAAESLALLLRLKGYEVEVVHDGPGALEKATSFQPEAVLLDIGLPGLDGFQVASELRRRPSTASALIVALTGYGQEDDQRRSREAGFDHHLIKPVDLQIVYELLVARRP
jgi:two-component system CheB/CheR fusion protein